MIIALTDTRYFIISHLRDFVLQVFADAFDFITIFSERK